MVRRGKWVPEKGETKLSDKRKCSTDILGIQLSG
jgi:hypothetical protein